MSKIKKLMAILVCCTLMLTMGSLAASAEEPIIPTPVDSTEGNVTIVPFADIIEYYYRSYNGILQYRRWNATRGYWVDPNWINM